MWGVERKSSAGLTSQSRPLVLLQVHPGVRALTGAALGPPTLLGGFLTPCPIRTHLLPLVTVRGNGPFG